jgi:hypothetical protein
MAAAVRSADGASPSSGTTRKRGPRLWSNSRAAWASVPAASAALRAENQWTARVKFRKKRRIVQALQSSR